MGMLGRCIGDTFPRVPRICACPLHVLPNESNSYDANGNRTNTGDVTGADNELLSDGTYNYSYDANGNLVKQVTIADNAEIDYAYDFRNRLVKVTNKDSNGLTTQVVDYSYDAFNRLVTRTLTPYTDGAASQPVSGHFVYDGDNMVLTLDDAGNVTNRALYGPAVDQVFAEEGASGDVTWAFGDNQNTSRDLAQYNAATGVTAIVNHRVFSAFGQLSSETDPTTGQPATVCILLRLHRLLFRRRHRPAVERESLVQPQHRALDGAGSNFSGHQFIPLLPQQPDPFRRSERVD